jgi:hypothetical protein
MNRDRDDEGFLTRWSRLKRSAPPSPTDAEAPGAPPAAEPVDAAERTELPLPSLDDVKPGADLSAFLKAHVPESLRRAALRKMWSLDPAIRDFREMADYDWDWNRPGGMPGFAELDVSADLKALAERVMSGSPPDAPPEDATAAPSLTASQDPKASLDSSETPAAALQHESRNAPEPTPGGRRRHGGALPS